MVLSFVYCNGFFRPGLVIVLQKWCQFEFLFTHSFPLPPPLFIYKSFGQNQRNIYQSKVTDPKLRISKPSYSLCYYYLSYPGDQISVTEPYCRDYQGFLMCVNFMALSPFTRKEDISQKKKCWLVCSHCSIRFWRLYG